MNQQFNQKTKSQKRHERRTIRRRNHQDKTINSEITKVICPPKIHEKINAWEWFANFLCDEYKFEAAVMDDIETKFLSKALYPRIENAIIVKTPYPGFSILITNIWQEHYIIMKYCNKKDTIGLYKIWIYDTHNNILPKQIYSGTKRDDIFDSIFGIDNFVNCSVAQKIIEHIHHSLKPINFCKFVHSLGADLILIEKAENYKDVLPVIASRNCPNYTCYLEKYNELLKSNKECSKRHYEYKLAFEALYQVVLRNILWINSIRNIVISYFI
jgi:hypothetical protein